MEQKTKSTVIGFDSAFVAVMAIILLFFAICGLTGCGDGDAVLENDKNNADKYVSENVVESDGNLVVSFDDSQPDDDTQDTSSQAVSSKPVSSEPEKKKAAHFGISDIESLCNSANTFSEFVSAVSPVSYEWSAHGWGANSYVTVKLTAADGSYAVIGVPYDDCVPSDNPGEMYVIDGKERGSGEDVKSWKVYEASKSEECYLEELVFFSNKMKFDMPRGIKIGSSYNSVLDAYLDLSTPDRTYLLYEAKDVFPELESENDSRIGLIGGKIYKISTYLNSFYKDNNDEYPFTGKCNSIIHYGYYSYNDYDGNSMPPHIIEYATKNHKVVGIRFCVFDYPN